MNFQENKFSKMIIHQPELTRNNGEIEVSARIKFNQSISNVPDRLWFRFPERCENYLTDRGDGFLLNMLIPAMHYGEEIDIHTEVSPRLLYNLKEYQYLLASAYPTLSRTNIKCKNIKAFEPMVTPESVLLTYSGGVDSTFALWSHLPQNQPITSMHITHGLLVQGFNAFDIPLENPVYFDYVYQTYDRLYHDLGLSLLYAKTNIHRFALFRIDWNIAYSAVLSGIVHLLAGLVKIYIAADDGGLHHHNTLYNDSESTQLLSSETLETVYFSRLYGREEKLKILAKWKPARTHLRVCLNWQKQPDQLNCSRCRKCYLNMITLELMGEYEKFSVFKQPFPHLVILSWIALLRAFPITYATLAILARENRRYGILLTLWLLAIPRKIYSWVFGKLDRCLSDEAKYKIRERIYNLPQVVEINDHT